MALYFFEMTCMIQVRARTLGELVRVAQAIIEGIQKASPASDAGPGCKLGLARLAAKAGAARSGLYRVSPDYPMGSVVIALCIQLPKMHDP